MSDDESSTSASTSTSTSTTSTSTNSAAVSTTTAAADYSGKIQSAIESLSSVVPSLSSPATFNSPSSLLNDPNVYVHISTLLREPNSGSGDNNLCRWLYDTFQSGVPDLQLLVLRFLPVIAGVYLSRIACRKSQAGFEAVLLALYAHETNDRNGQAVTVTIPDLSQPSVYHEARVPVNKNNATDLNLTVVSPTLEPHGTVRCTRRARIVGVALELFYSKISQMPVGPKIDFCEFCKVWAGQDGEMYKDGGGGGGGGGENLLLEEDKGENKIAKGRVPLPWELLEPVLRILGHCLMAPDINKDTMLFGVASEACRSLYARSVHDVNPKAILATGCLVRLSNAALKNVDDSDPTELPVTNVISL